MKEKGVKDDRIRNPYYEKLKKERETDWKYTFLKGILTETIIEDIIKILYDCKNDGVQYCDEVCSNRIKFFLQKHCKDLTEKNIDFIVLANTIAYLADRMDTLCKQMRENMENDITTTM
jgi:hypothetical protein